MSHRLCSWSCIVRFFILLVFLLFFLTAKEETSSKDAAYLKTAEILATTTLASLFCLSLNVEVTVTEKLSLDE